MLTKSLTWALVIATYKREHILLRCLRLAANQTRPPKEIIVVDASPDYEKIRDLVSQEFSESYPQINLIYVKANRPSLTVQRNQGIKLSSADVLFLIDDDSLMYPDCAEEIVKIYEADTKAIVKGISAIPVPEPPEVQSFAGQHENQKGTLAIKPRETLPRGFIKLLLRNEKTYFLPYNEDYPAHQIPKKVENLNFGIIKVMAGFAMTFSRQILQKELFSENLSRYAAGEDQDLSYRVSRHGLIINTTNAKLCHLEISGRRLSSYTVAVLAVFNSVVLHQLYSSDTKHSIKEWKQIIQRRILINLLKETAKKINLPKTRGIIYTSNKLQLVYSKPREELLEWYPKF